MKRPLPRSGFVCNIILPMSRYPMSKKFTNQKSSTRIQNKQTTYLIYGLMSLIYRGIPKTLKSILSKRFFKPTRYQVNDIEKDYLLKGKTFQVPVWDKTVHCWCWGRGPAVLFVHGWNGRDIQFHRFFEMRSVGKPKWSFKTQIEKQRCIVQL